jgi:DNA-binding NarL/FixJ family response regulator
MLYGVHVYARAKVFPDLAIERGEQAYQAGKRMGDRMLEFAAAGGVALAFSDIGDIDSARDWLSKAASVAASSPTQHRARQMELWRGLVAAAAGDAAHMQEHLQRAVQLALDHGRPAARCQALAWLATSAAELGAASNDHDLLELAVNAGLDAKAVASMLPGHPPWGPQADAALARAALARGQTEDAAAAGRAAMHGLEEAVREDAFLEVVLPAARAILAGGTDEEKEQTRGRLQVMLTAYVQRILDQDLRVKWLRSHWGSALAELAGPIEIPAATTPAGMGDEEQTKLLTLLVEGRTNAEIASVLGMTEEAVDMQLSELFARMGASSRAEATAFALMGRMI